MEPAGAIFVLAVNSLAMAALFHLVGRRMPADCGLHAIAAGSALFGLACLSRFLSNFDAAVPYSVSSDTAMVGAALLFLRGVGRFTGQSAVGARRILVLGAGYGLVATMTLVHSGVVGRHVLLSLTLGSIYGLLAWTAAVAARRDSASLRAPLWALTALVGVLSALTALRAVLVVVHGPDAGYHGLGSQVYYAYAMLASALLGPVLIWLVFAQLNGHLADVASRDELTRVLNRKGLHDALRRHFGRGAGVSVTWLQVDIDHFKQINDSHGHAAGDDVLRAVAAVLRDSIRAGDFVAAPVARNS